jgi:hypothetical protein
MRHTCIAGCLMAHVAGLLHDCAVVRQGQRLLSVAGSSCWALLPGPWCIHVQAVQRAAAHHCRVPMSILVALDRSQPLQATTRFSGGPGGQLAPAWSCLDDSWVCSPGTQVADVRPVIAEELQVGVPLQHRPRTTECEKGMTTDGLRGET